MQMEIEKPQIKCEEAGDLNSVTYTLEPLERGYGTTLGNLLRRVLLSNLPGTAVVAVRIEGVTNEFSILKGVREDVTDIVLNLKSLVLKSTNQTAEFRTSLRVQKNGIGVVTAKDIVCPPEVQILNTDLIICTLDSGAKLDMEIVVGNGRGYVTAKDHKGATEVADFIAIDSCFSPVEKCNYYVDVARVGQKIDYDKLVLEVSTNGGASAKEAIRLAAMLVQDHLELFVDSSKKMNTLVDHKFDNRKHLLESSIEDLELSQRSSNCLKRANIFTIDDLTKKSKSEMIKVRNLGSKSLEEIVFKLESLGLAFAPDPEEVL